CNQFSYDSSIIRDSVVKDWNLICEREELRARISAAPMLGILIGGIVFGPLSDNGDVNHFSYLYTHYVFIGDSYGLCSGVLYLLSLTGPCWVCLTWYTDILLCHGHGNPGLLCWYFESFGFLLTVALAISITQIGESFRQFTLYLSHSPRWLISHDKYSEASTIIAKILNKNGFDGDLESPVIVDSLKKNSEADSSLLPHYSLLDLFKHPHLRLKTLILNWLWVVTSSLYYVLLLDQSELSDNLYLGFSLTALVQIPGYILISFILDRPALGRKKSMIFMLLLTGGSLILHPLVPSEPQFHWIKLGFSLVGRFATNCSYTILCIYSSEHFSFTISKIGCILGPYILMMGPNWPIVFGIGTILGALFSIFLPETLGAQLPDTISESEAFKVYIPYLRPSELSEKNKEKPKE
ncbi:Uncharacterized protein FKW44_023722, partial [Caligus rogercresseyi]